MTAACFTHSSRPLKGLSAIEGGDAPPPPFFVVLKNHLTHMTKLGRNYWLLWSGFSISTIGTYLSLIVMNLFIYSVTKSPLLVGVFLLFRLVPAFFMGSVAGLISDKFERKYLIITADLFRAALIFSVIFLRENIYPLYIIIFLIAVFDRLYQSAMGGGIPNIVGKENMTIANSYLAAGRTIALVTGPIVGGLLISAGSYGIAFGIDAATYLFSAAAVSIMSCSFHDTSVARSKNGFWQGIKGGYNFIFARAGLFSIILLRCLDAFGSSALNVGQPVFTSELKEFTPGICYGLMFAAFGIGEMIGALFLSRRRFVQDVAPEIVIGVTIFIMALAFGISLSTGHIFHAMFFIWLCGIAEGVTTVVYNIRLQKNPDEIRGRVVGFSETSVWSAMGVGMFLAGLAAEWLDITHVVQIFAAIICIGCLVHLSVWRLRPTSNRIEDVDYV